MDKKERKETDLHIHSNYSDGDCSVEELVSRIKGVGLKAAVLTDHDRTEGLIEFIKLCGRDIDTFAGIEVSASSDDVGMSVHILGYGFDISLLERNCRDILRHNIDLRQKNIKKTISLYQQKLRMIFCFEDLKPLCFFLPAEVQSIYWVIKYRAECLQVLMEQSGQAFDFKEAYKMAEEETTENGICYSPFVGKYVEYQAVIRGIKSSKGLAVWAHPAETINRLKKRFGSEKVARRLFEDSLKFFVNEGLAGLEVFSAFESTEEEIEFLLGCCSKYNLIILGGSDYHGDMPDEHKPDRWLGRNGVSYQEFLKIKEAISLRQ